MRPVPPGRLIAVALVLTGCAADLGLGAGAKAGNAVAFGRVAGLTRFGTPMNERGFLIGAALESRGEEDVGSRWSTGVMVGYGFGPPKFDGQVGLDVFGEAGIPLRGEYHDLYDSYLGFGADVPFILWPGRNVIDLNQSTFILKRRIELVPFGRARAYVQNGVEFGDAVEWSAGFAFRFRLMTDLL